MPRISFSCLTALSSNGKFSSTESRHLSAPWLKSYKKHTVFTQLIIGISKVAYIIHLFKGVYFFSYLAKKVSQKCILDFFQIFFFCKYWVDPMTSQFCYNLVSDQASPYPGSLECDCINIFPWNWPVCVILPLSSTWIFLYSLPHCTFLPCLGGIFVSFHNTYVNIYIDTPSHSPHIEACLFTHTKSFLLWEKCRGLSWRTSLHLWASAVIWAKTSHDHPLAFVGTSSAWSKGLWEGRCSITHNGQLCSGFILLHGLDSCGPSAIAYLFLLILLRYLVASAWVGTAASPSCIQFFCVIALRYVKRKWLSFFFFQKNDNPAPSSTLYPRQKFRSLTFSLFV